MKCGNCRAKVGWVWDRPAGRHEANCLRCGTRYIRSRRRHVIALLVYGAAFIPLLAVVYWSTFVRPRPPALMNWFAVYVVTGLALPWGVHQLFALRWPLVRRLKPYECEHCGYDTSAVKHDICSECGKAWRRGA